MDVAHDDPNDANDVDVYDINREFIPTPKGHKYWVPNVPVGEKPKKFTVFNTFDDAYYMYKVYAAKATFDNHNHSLIDVSNMDLSRAGRKLEFGEYMFIHRVSLSNIGPQKAHMLRVALLVNYVAFDNVSFDATFDTNKNDIVFVPFTSIVHLHKCVTFGAAFCPDETYDLYCWLLEAFLKVHGKQPPLAITHQDGGSWIFQGVAYVRVDEDNVTFKKFERILSDLFSSWKLASTFDALF
ncbi:FAR1-related sequence 5-like protein [Tanacetum coccineum]